VSASVLICPYTKLTWGHLTRCFALGSALVARGARVTFACAPEAAERVTAAGFAHVPLVALGDLGLLRPPTTARAAARVRRGFGGELDAAAACFGALAPDVVVTDLQPLVNVAAALAAIPSASLLNLGLFAQPLAFWLPALDRILGALAIPRWAAARLFGDALLVADAPNELGLRDLPPELTARVTASVRELRFVGPLLGDLPRRPRRRRRRRARPEVPEVIVSLGGGLQGRAADIVAGCAAIDADLVVIAPEPVDELVRVAEERRRAGRGVAIVGFLSDFAARIAEADALVTHGGHSTLSLALALAVPTLAVPSSIEQEINARQLHGIGAVASPNRSELRATIGGQLAALLGDRAGDRARARRAAALATYDAARDAARVVERLAREPPLGST